MTDARALHGPGELIAALPMLIGHTPADSVVVAGIDRRDALATVLRVDRRDLLDPGAAGMLGRALAAQLVRASCRIAVVVTYTDEDVRLACPAIDALRPALADAVEEVEGWAVRAGRYFAPGCARESCCPAGGRPIPSVPASVGGSSVVRAARHDALSDEPDAAYLVDEPTRRRVARASQRWIAHRDEDARAWRRGSLDRWRSAVEGVARGEFPTDPESGRIVAGLQDRRVRDAVLVSLIPGFAHLASRVVVGDADREVREAMKVLLAPDAGRPPDRGTVEPAWDLGAWLIARARVDARAPMLTLCALIAWWEGDEASCRSLVRRAHASKPGYRLASLLECTMLAGINPGWRRAA